MRFVFVHGTGVRHTWFNVACASVKSQLAERNLGELAPCYWGEKAGSPDITQFNSIPEFAERGGTDKQNAAAADSAIWQVLALDPFAELDIFAAVQANDGGSLSKVGTAIRNTLRTCDIPSDVRELADKGGIAERLEASIMIMQERDAYQDAIVAAGDQPNAAREILARCIIAIAIRTATDDQPLPQVGFDEKLRSLTTECLASWIYPKTMGIAESFFGLLKPFAISAAMGYAHQHYGYLVSQHYRFIADILMYQTRGSLIRDIIRESLMSSKDSTVLIGHSLGGIAAFDLLIEVSKTDPDTVSHVRGLVTVGSQAPFFYEADCSASLRRGEPLPDRFPQWLNILDRSDLLSFLSSNVFPGREDGDLVVNSGLPFPQSHGGYWSNPQVWDSIENFARSAIK